MNVETIRKLFDYHYGMYGQVWDCIMHLSDEQFVQEVDYSIGSVRNHMVHMLSIDQWWVARIQGLPLPEFSPEEFKTREVVRGEWDKAVDRVMTYINKLTEAELARTMEFHFDNKVYTAAVWMVLIHVANHGTDHRSQILRLLHDLGAPTLEHELMDYLWSEA
jgi:uncharacterized damage-inducible protein DinB